MRLCHRRRLRRRGVGGGGVRTTSITLFHSRKFNYVYSSWIITPTVFETAYSFQYKMCDCIIIIVVVVSVVEVFHSRIFHSVYSSWIITPSVFETACSFQYKMCDCIIIIVVVVSALEVSVEAAYGLHLSHCSIVVYSISFKVAGL